MSQNPLNERMRYFREQLQQQQQRGLLQRVFAWLLLGVVLFVGLTLLVISLLLSWLLIPIMLYRNRQRRQAAHQAQKSAESYKQPPRQSRVIEGEVIDKSE